MISMVVNISGIVISQEALDISNAQVSAIPALAS